MVFPMAQCTEVWHGHVLKFQNSQPAGYETFLTQIRNRIVCAEDDVQEVLAQTCDSMKDGRPDSKMFKDVQSPSLKGKIPLKHHPIASHKISSPHPAISTDMHLFMVSGWSLLPCPTRVGRGTAETSALHLGLHRPAAPLRRSSRQHGTSPWEGRWVRCRANGAGHETGHGRVESLLGTFLQDQRGDMAEIDEVDLQIFCSEWVGGLKCLAVFMFFRLVCWWHVEFYVQSMLFSLTSPTFRGANRGELAKVRNDWGPPGSSALSHGRKAGDASKLFTRSTQPGLCYLGGPLASRASSLKLKRSIFEDLFDVYGWYVDVCVCVKFGCIWLLTMFLFILLMFPIHMAMHLIEFGLVPQFLGRHGTHNLVFIGSAAL